MNKSSTWLYDISLSALARKTIIVFQVMVATVYYPVGTSRCLILPNDNAIEMPVGLICVCIHIIRTSDHLVGVFAHDSRMQRRGGRAAARRAGDVVKSHIRNWMEVLAVRVQACPCHSCLHSTACTVPRPPAHSSATSERETDNAILWELLKNSNRLRYEPLTCGTIG